MSLDPGTRLGPYHVAGLLGAGGMGEVYRATDTTLKRDVAIKILPAAFANDPERLARFEREAQMLAQLHHPNIASIFGLHEEAGVRFLAMELVPGETLEQRIKRGPIPIDEAIVTAKKIADGLEYAHERGIVHRDLKPANIKITPDGDVKILDFGLAKAITGETVAAGPTSTPTIVPTMTSVGTAIGIILGTAAYMSPEQARGRPVDKRADIWAFGAVVYEMLTGQRLFDGETVSDTLAAVLTRSIDTEALGGAVPLRLRRLLARCLDRDPKLRLRDIGEARVALETAEVPIAAVAVTAHARKRRTWLLAAIPVALVAGIIAGWFLKAGPKAEARDAKWALAIPDGLKIASGDDPGIAISADGKLQAMVVIDAGAVTRILLRSQSAFEPRLLPETERATSPFFSPNANWIGFFRDGAMFKIPVGGGPPIRLTSLSGQPRGGSWSSDGYIYFSPDTATAIMRVPQDGGEATPVTKVEESRNERTHRWADALPGGAILFTCDDNASTEYYDDSRIEAVLPATGERKVLVEGSSMARYATSGHLVFARGGSLYAVRFDPESLTASGSPVLVAQDVATNVGTGAVRFAIAGDGSALWIPGSAEISYRQVWMDRAGAESSIPLPPAPYNELALSPDGKRVALVGGEGGVADLWVYDFARDSLSRLSVGQFIQRPVWSPDGKRIAYGTRLQGQKTKGNTWQIAIKPADGSHDEEVFLERERGHVPSSFTPDGKTLVFDALDTGATRRDIFALPLEGKREPVPLVSGPFIKQSAVVSPDGRWLAYVSDESGQPGVYVRPFPSGEGRWQISTPRGLEPRWRPDGKELFYRTDGVMYAVTIDTTHGFSASRPVQQFDRGGTGIGLSTYGLTPDGKRFCTFRFPEGQGERRMLYLDQGFARRLAK